MQQFPSIIGRNIVLPCEHWPPRNDLLYPATVWFWKIHLNSHTNDKTLIFSKIQVTLKASLEYLERFLYCASFPWWKVQSHEEKTMITWFSRAQSWHRSADKTRTYWYKEHKTLHSQRLWEALLAQSLRCSYSPPCTLYILLVLPPL